MAKATGLGQFILVAGVDLSGDTQSVSVRGGPAPIELTGINKSAPERAGGRLDGGIDWVSFFDDAAGQAHPTLKGLPTTSVHVMYGDASTIGQPAACEVAKQINYDPTLGNDGTLTLAVQSMVSDGASVEWCDLLTAGLRTDTAATNGSSLDGAAATTTGWAAYLQVSAFSGTDVTITIQDSADNSSWANVTGGAFTQVTSGPTTERIEGAAGATLRRYVRVITTTSGGVTSVTFAVAITRHPTGAAA